MPTLDPDLLAGAGAWLATSLPNALAALAFVVAGLWLSGLAERTLLKVMDRQLGVDPTLRGVLGSTVRYSVLLLLLIAALGQLGFQTSSILAVLATAGLAIGLALQATLANIAAGIMLLWLRPFRVGDLIEVGGLTGKVVEVGLFASEIHSLDGLYQFVPNSEIWNKRLTNFSRLDSRQISLRVTAADAQTVARLRSWLADFAVIDKRVLAEPAPAVVVNDVAFDKITCTVQVWTTTADYRAVSVEIADKLPMLVGRSHGDE